MLNQKDRWIMSSPQIRQKARWIGVPVTSAGRQKMRMTWVADDEDAHLAAGRPGVELPPATAAIPPEPHLPRLATTRKHQLDRRIRWQWRPRPHPGTRNRSNRRRAGGGWCASREGGKGSASSRLPRRLVGQPVGCRVPGVLGCRQEGDGDAPAARPPLAGWRCGRRRLLPCSVMLTWQQHQHDAAGLLPSSQQ